VGGTSNGDSFSAFTTACFYVVTQCQLIGGYQCFGETYSSEKF